MRFPRLTHRLALGMGAIGLVLASGGAAAAAVSAIQPAGALSAQVPAVGVREQNVNSAGRIRVALPKGSLGVNGSVSVSNLPENSAGRVKVSAGAPGEPYTAVFGGTVPDNGQPTTLVSLAGRGMLKGLVAGNVSGDSNEIFILTIDGHTILNDGQNGYAWLGDSSFWGGNSSAPADCSSCYAMHFFPPGGLAFSKSLVLQAMPTQGHADTTYARVLYTTPS